MHPISIVDDDVRELEILSDVLELAGYSTMCAQSGKEALDLLCTAPAPAMILLDLKLPIMSGWQFLN